mmetsp:Transcript_7933/g.7489  ORF Transcript_7933/g.7489 Transcript_7933/m.7489 type:complete len:97 (-) Transcript_7933:91-381(-)
MKTCKEKGAKVKRKEKKLDTPKYDKQYHPLIGGCKTTKHAVLDVPSEYFGTRSGSMDVNYQLKAFLGPKKSLRSDFSTSNRSNNSRQNSVKPGLSH